VKTAALVRASDEGEKASKPEHGYVETILSKGQLKDGCEEQGECGNAGTHRDDVCIGIRGKGKNELRKGRKSERNPAKQPELVESGCIIAFEMDEKDKQGEASRCFKERDSLEALIRNHGAPPKSNPHVNGERTLGFPRRKRNYPLD